MQSYDDTLGVSGKFYTSLTNTIKNNVIGSLTTVANYGVRETLDGSDYTSVVGNSFAGFDATHTAVVTGAHSTIDAGNPPPIDNGSHDLLIGTTGNDVLDGGAGNDTLDGGAGKDPLTGGVGNDVFRFSKAEDSNDVSAQDTITDFVHGVDKIDLRSLGFTELTTKGTTLAGELRLAYSAANDRTYIRSDQSTFEVILLGNHKDTLSASDFIFSGVTPPPVSNDIVGTAGNDVLSGTANADVIKALAGNDTVIGGAGADTLTGGEGQDVFRYVATTESHATHGRDTITDFVSGVDKLDVKSLGFTGLTLKGTTQAGELRVLMMQQKSRMSYRIKQDLMFR